MASAIINCMILMLLLGGVLVGIVVGVGTEIGVGVGIEIGVGTKVDVVVVVATMGAVCVYSKTLRPFLHKTRYFVNFQAITI